MSHRSPWTSDEFLKLEGPWKPSDRVPIMERLKHYERQQLQNFTGEEAALLQAILNRLIPQEEDINLVSFIDAYLGQPMGRGDKSPGQPDEAILIKQGLQKLADRSFVNLTEQDQDAVLKEMQGELFFQRLYSKALHGYFGHPRVWQRIGFMGVAYPEGYAWFSKGQVKARREKQPGWEVM